MKNLFSENNNQEKGAVAILLTLLILSVIFLIVFGLSAIFVNELKISSWARRSTPAFYAADAGAEYALYRVTQSGNASENFSGDLHIGASFSGSWDKNTRRILSSGRYLQTVRKVEINF